MKISYLLTAAAFALGLGLLSWGTASHDEVTLLGVTFHPRLAKSVGLVTMLLGAIAFLAVFGNSLPPTEAERRREALRLEIAERYRSKQNSVHLQRDDGAEGPRAGRLANADRAPEKLSQPAKDSA
jgi:hypothetical protein